MDKLSGLSREKFLDDVSHWKEDVRNTLHVFDRLGRHPLGTDKLIKMYRELYMKLDEIKHYFMTEAIDDEEGKCEKK